MKIKRSKREDGDKTTRLPGPLMDIKDPEAKGKELAIEIRHRMMNAAAGLALYADQVNLLKHGRQGVCIFQTTVLYELRYAKLI